MSDEARATDRDEVDPSAVRRSRLVNLALATLLGAECAYAIYGNPYFEEVAWWLVVSSFLIVNTIRRLPAKETDNRWWVWLACTASFLHPFAFEHGEQTRWAYLLLLLLMLAADANLIYLGRSFSILPARREIRTGLLYGVVRHPVYAIYILLDVIYVSIVPSWRNGIVLIASTILVLARADLEERLLRNDPEYVSYAERVRYRFFPRIY